MHGDTKLLINASRAASRYLQRDVFELENLQDNGKINQLFSQKSCLKSIELLKNSLTDYFDHLVFLPRTEEEKHTGRIIFIELLDGYNNFARALPYFGLMLSLVIRNNNNEKTYCSVINLPALGEIYYTENGRGAWLEQLMPKMNGARRLRLKTNYEPGNILLAAEHSTLTVAQTISSNIRLFESSTYSLTQLLRGKFDSFITQKSDSSLAGYKLFLSEAGGTYQSFNGNFIATNLKLSTKIAQLLA